MYIIGWNSSDKSLIIHTLVSVVKIKCFSFSNEFFISFFLPLSPVAFVVLLFVTLYAVLSIHYNFAYICCKHWLTVKYFSFLYLYVQIPLIFYLLNLCLVKFGRLICGKLDMTLCRNLLHIYPYHLDRFFYFRSEYIFNASLKNNICYCYPIMHTFSYWRVIIVNSLNCSTICIWL